MSEQTKTIALAVSVTLNVVLIAAVVGGLYFAKQAWKERGDRGAAPLFETARALPQEDQDRLREGMRAAARTARPEFRASREHRKRAAELAAAPAYDRTAVLNALSQANAAEMRARTTLDNQLTSQFAGLGPEERKTLAPVLERRSRGMRGRRGRDRDRDRDRDEAPDAPAATDTPPSQ